MGFNTSTMQPNSSLPAICGHLAFTVNMVSYVPNNAAQAVTFFTCIFNAVSFPFTLIGNVLVFVGVLRKQELRTVHYTSILFLAATDLVVALVAQPGFVIFQASKLSRGSAFSCVALAVYTSTVFLCTGLSILTLIIITVERYFAIFYPFKYQQFVTKSRLVGCIFVVWMIWTVFIGVIRFATGTTTSTLSVIATVLILSCLIITLFVYYKVQKLVRRNRRTAVPEPTVSACTESSAESNRTRNVPETKTSRTAAILTGTLAVCLLPTLISSSVFQANATNEVTLYHVIYPLTDTAVILNSTLNPFIYVFRSDIMQRSIRDLCKRWSN